MNPSPQILLTDDDANFRSAQARLLRKIQLTPGIPTRILEAENGACAMNILAKEPVECILLDHDMPGGSGMHWLKIILQNYPDMPIIILTGHGSEKLAVDAMKNGAMDYLSKGSITRDEMERTIRNAIEKVALQKTIDQQQKELLDAERQRVMIESLGAACHHIGQPATVINAYLQMMQKQETDQETLDMINSCLEASESIRKILHQLQQVSLYRTTPYLPGSAGQPEGSDTIIALP